MMENKNNILDELNVSKQPDIPKDYFKSISSNVLTKIEQENTTTPSSFNIKWGFIAACASILLFLGLQFNTQSDALISTVEIQNTQLALNQDQEDIADFLLEFDDLEFADTELDLEEI